MTRTASELPSSAWNLVAEIAERIAMLRENDELLLRRRDDVHSHSPTRNAAGVKMCSRTRDRVLPNFRSCPLRQTVCAGVSGAFRFPPGVRRWCVRQWPDRRPLLFPPCASSGGSPEQASGFVVEDGRPRWCEATSPPRLRKPGNTSPTDGRAIHGAAARERLV